MQVYQGAKQLKISNKELIQLIDIPEVDHHMDKIPDELLEELGLVEKKIETPEPEPTETVDSAETVVVEDIDLVEEVLAEIEGKEVHKPIVKDEKVPSLEEIELGIRGCGNKSSMWKWRHLLDE
jgi:hypothetical protein